jgi:sodium transport system permease protein
VQRGTLVVGKWLATTVFSCAMVVVVAVAFVLVAKRVPLQDLGVKVSLDAVAAVGMMGAVLPLALLASAMQMLVATFARSFKEAQTYLQLLMMLPMIPGMMLALSPIQSQTWMYMVPVLGQELLVSELMRGEPLGVLPFVLSMVGCVALAAVCLTAISRLLSDEKIVFGRS